MRSSTRGWVVVDRNGSSHPVVVHAAHVVERNVPLWSVLALLAAVVFGVGSMMP